MEMVLVLLIASILAVTATADWPAKALSLRGETDQVRADLALAQGLALSRGVAVTIQRGDDGSHYRLTSGGTPPLQEEIVLRHATLNAFSLTFDRYGHPGPADQEVVLTHRNLPTLHQRLRVVGVSGAVVE